MTWLVDTWVPPVRDEERRIVKHGFWSRRASVETEEEAEKMVLHVTRALGLNARARPRDPPEDGTTGMLSRPSGFAKWTGSGGRIV